jgi:predicted nucleic acid-binding protein
MIAATALAHGFALVTRNTAHFSRTGVSLINPRDTA